VANMRNIGKEEETSGGIILATSLSFTSGAERLIYLKLRQVRTGTATDGMVQLARQAMEWSDSAAARAMEPRASKPRLQP